MKIKTLSFAMCFVLLMGCAAKQPQPSGFMSDYDKLVEVPTMGSAKVWKKPGVDPAEYDSIIVEPVVLGFDRDDEKYTALDPMELEALAAYARMVLVETLSHSYAIVEKPGKRTVVIRAAITDVEPSVPAMLAVSSVMPVGIALSYGREALTGSHSWVGTVEYEIEFRDGRTGEPLAMLMNRKEGEKWDLDGVLDDFGHVRSEFDLIAENLCSELWYFAPNNTP